MDRELLTEFSRVRQLREDADCEIDVDIDRETAKDAVETAERFSPKRRTFWTRNEGEA
jgi:uncharacterized protein (UPF0332 family)